jgi:hypothetical protein
MSTASRNGLYTGAEEVRAELEAMQVVGRALSRLQDPRARARVLRWAVERFETQPERAAAGSRAMAVAVAAPSIDSSVSVEGLHELFDVPPAGTRPENVHLEGIEPGRAAEPAFVIEPAFSHRTAAQPQTSRREPTDSEPLDSLMRGLATDFQRFAVEWQRA